MKKNVKITLIVVASIVLVYGLFVTLDCIRLKNSKIGTKPLIVLSQENSSDKLIYNGLGYKVVYYTNEKRISSDLIIAEIYGSEFRLFDTFLIWAYVE